MQDLMKYDPQQRPTASQTLQYPFFQVNSSMPAPEVAENNRAAATFTRRPIQVDTSSTTLSSPQCHIIISHCHESIILSHTFPSTTPLPTHSRTLAFAY